MTKKKSFVSLVLAICLIVPAMFMLTACGSGDNSQKLTNDSGIEVVGDFEKGAVLETSTIDSTSESYTSTISLIESEDYDDEKPVYIFEIAIKKDGVKVQPNGKVRVTIPVSVDLTGYVVLHIKGDGKIERLSVGYKNGKATFETNSFSTFVFVATDAVDINPTPSTPADSGSETEWNSAIDFWKKQTNVKVVERTSSNGGTDTSVRVNLYQLDVNAYYEDSYVEGNAETMNYKGKGTYLVKENDGTYSYYNCNDKGDGTVIWYKNSSTSNQSAYDNELESKIYGWCDPGMDYGVYSKVINFDYSNFEYDTALGLYKIKDGENITVKLTFGGSNLTKIVVTRVKDGLTYERTITFGNAEVNVPTENVVTAE